MATARTIRRTILLTGLLALVFAIFGLNGCGKPESLDEKDRGSANVSADNPNAVISDTLRMLKGRWVEEIPSTIKPDIPTMRIHATANDTLSGRFLIAGGYADTGIAITIQQQGDRFILTLVDDELRPHGWIPKNRTFEGTFDPATGTFSFKNNDGEYIEWEFPPGEPAWRAYFTARIYSCRFVPAPQPSPGPGGGGGGSDGGSGGDGGGSDGGGGDSGGGEGGGGEESLRSPIAHAAYTVAMSPRRPRPRPIIEDPDDPAAEDPRHVESCGVMSSSKDKWARMSGSQ